MVVGINGFWKIPVTSFFLNGTHANEKANITNHVLNLSTNLKVLVTSFIFDGTPTNLKSAEVLGVKYKDQNIIPHFPHPVTKDNVYIFLPNDRIFHF